MNKFHLLNKPFLYFSHTIIKEKSSMIWHQNANEPALLNCWSEGTQLWFEAFVKKAQYHEHWLPSLLLPQFLYATSLFPRKIEQTLLWDKCFNKHSSEQVPLHKPTTTILLQQDSPEPEWPLFNNHSKEFCISL